MPYKDPIAAKASSLERGRRYRRRLKALKYGQALADVNMSGKHGNHARGRRNGRWNKGTLMSSQGYVLRRVPKGHHRGFGPPGCKHQYAYEHDLVAEEMIGRRLLHGEVVHHKNGNRSDNSPGNLEITTRSDHAREHVSFPGARNHLGMFTQGKRSRSEWPDDLRVREFPTVNTTTT